MDRATRATGRVVDALRPLNQEDRARVLRMASARFGIVNAGQRGRPPFATAQLVEFLREEGGSITVERLAHLARIGRRAADIRLYRAVRAGAVVKDGAIYVEAGGAR